MKSVEEEQISLRETNTAYTKVKKILDAAEGKGLFKDIQDPLEWQRSIRKEWEHDF